MRDDGGVAGTKGKQSVRDMVLSMAVIGVVVAGIYLFIPHDDSADPVKRTDYTVELATARRAAPYPVAAPEGLPESWTATSVRYRGAGQSGAAWHLGFLDPERQYIGVEQSDAKASVFIDAVSQGAKRTDATEDIGGESWQRYAGDRYNALVREAGGANGATTVVTGSASWEHLAQMAKALRTN
jgi:hypothetical protein